MSPKTPKNPIPIRIKPPDEEVEEQIRQLAYQLYEKRGRLDGNAVEDWLIAEEEVLGSRRAEQAEAATASS